MAHVLNEILNSKKNQDLKIGQSYNCGFSSVVWPIDWMGLRGVWFFQNFYNVFIISYINSYKKFLYQITV